MLSPTTTIHKR